MPREKKQALLNKLWQTKMHTTPRALELSGRSVQESFGDIWEPSRLLSKELEQFPNGFLRFWLRQERGHLLFWHLPSQYNPGTVEWGRSAWQAVACISAADVAQHNKEALIVIFELFDHLMGSGARADGPRLSDGTGLAPKLERAAQRFARINELGYGHEELGARNTHDYFALSLYAYLYNGEQLNVLDPLVYKLYNGTLLREGFWRGLES